MADSSSKPPEALPGPVQRLDLPPPSMRRELPTMTDEDRAEFIAWLDLVERTPLPPEEEALDIVAIVDGRCSG